MARNNYLRVEFKLSMPSNGSWDGKWSGASRNYSVVRSVSDEQIERLGLDDGYFSYSWDDGWTAGIITRIMEKGKRRKKSDGFLGYEWMISNILAWGKPEYECVVNDTHNWVNDPHQDGWVRCTKCQRSRAIAKATT